MFNQNETPMYEDIKQLIEVIRKNCLGEKQRK